MTFDLEELTLAQEILRKPNRIIFDVGIAKDSLFKDLKGHEVHFFEPNGPDLDEFKKKDNNPKSHYNYFGLSNKNENLKWNPTVQSFIRKLTRDPSTPRDDYPILPLKRADEYIKEKKIEVIHFLKIDVEGFEKHVVEGFGDFLNNVEVIQFEYGGTWNPNDRYDDCETTNPATLSNILSYLEEYGFDTFNDITHNRPLTDRKDTYQYMNIACYRSGNA